MSLFPGPGANIIRNEAGEPLGWDYPPEPDFDYDPDDYLPDWEDDDIDDEPDDEDF